MPRPVADVLRLEEDELRLALEVEFDLGLVAEEERTVVVEPEDLTELLTVPVLRVVEVEELDVPRNVLEELAALRDVVFGVEAEAEALRTEGVAVVEAVVVPRPVAVLLPAEPRPVTEVVVIFVASAFWRMSYALRTIPLPESERGVFALRSVNERSGCCAP